MIAGTPDSAADVSAKTVAVLDYGSGNIRSAERAIARSGVQVQVTSDADIALAADGLVVPGVGAFAACMDGLLAVGGDKIITERIRLKRPVLGICVGHQVLFARGIEHGRMTQGCGLWPGDVEQIEAHRLPHMGWNSLQTGSDSAMFAGVEEERFYFVHSYAVRSFAAPPGAVTTWAEHGGDRFLAGVEDGVLWSTQFHPEKSGDAGAQLIKNWVGTL